MEQRYFSMTKKHILCFILIRVSGDITFQTEDSDDVGEDTIDNSPYGWLEFIQGKKIASETTYVIKGVKSRILLATSRSSAKTSQPKKKIDRLPPLKQVDSSVLLHEVEGGLNKGACDSPHASFYQGHTMSVPTLTTKEKTL